MKGAQGNSRRGTLSISTAASSAARTLILALLVQACAPFRAAPPVEPGEWRSALGSSARAAYAAVEVGNSVRVAWRKGYGRGIAVALQVHDPLLIATTTGRTVVTVNEATGMQYWARRFNAPIAGSALRRNETVYLATGDRDNRFHAISLTRGKKIWSSRRFGPFRVEPLLLDDRLVGVTESGLVVAVRESDGSELWRSSLGAPPASPPVQHGEHVLLTSTRDSLYRIRVTDGTVTDRLALPGTASAPPLVSGGMMTLPVYPNHVVTVDLDRLTVSAAVPLSAPVLAAPVPGDRGEAFLLTRVGDVYRLANGSAQRIAQLGGAATGSLAAVGRHLAVGRLDGVLFFLRLDGQVVWREEFDDSITAPVAARDGVLFVPLLHGDIVKLESQ